MTNWWEDSPWKACFSSHGTLVRRFSSKRLVFPLSLCYLLFVSSKWHQSALKKTPNNQHGINEKGANYVNSLSSSISISLFEWCFGSLIHVTSFGWLMLFNVAFHFIFYWYLPIYVFFCLIDTFEFTNQIYPMGAS